MKDRHTKYDLYQKEHIPYYLIIDPDEKKIEKFVLSKDNTFVRQDDLNSFTLKEGCTIEINLTEIWV